MRILVTAGEPSGDLHAASVISALVSRLPRAEIEAVGGPQMAAAGAELRYSIDGLSAMGLVEVVGAIPRHWRLLKALRRDFAAGRYDLLITVDYPGFHFHVAEVARARNVPVLWYIAPQVWAWRRSRAARLGRTVNQLAVILPFEPAFFQAEGVPSVYVGHPLVEQQRPDRVRARRELAIDPGERVLALFPGSRSGEVHRLWPEYREAARLVQAQGGVDRVLVAGTEWGEYPGAEEFSLWRGRSHQVLAAADAVLAKSGTTTLEAALADVPMVVAYRLNPLTWRLMKPMFTARWASLPNLILERDAVPELLQEDATPSRLCRAVMPLLQNGSTQRQDQLEALAEVRRRLGGPGASERVAELAEGLLRL